MHAVANAFLFVAIVIAVFVCKQAVHNYARAKRADGTAGPMKGNLFGSVRLTRQNGRPLVNRAGFVVLSVIITVALILSLRTEHDSVYADRETEALIAVGMAVIVVVGLVTWNRNHS
jgi:hypothetical protein